MFGKNICLFLVRNLVNFLVFKNFLFFKILGAESFQFWIPLAWIRLFQIFDNVFIVFLFFLFDNYFVLFVHLNPLIWPSMLVIFTAFNTFYILDFVITPRCIITSDPDDFFLEGRCLIGSKCPDRIFLLSCPQLVLPQVLSTACFESTIWAISFKTLWLALQWLVWFVSGGCYSQHWLAPILQSYGLKVFHNLYLN